jgi:hypothetical protein
VEHGIAVALGSGLFQNRFDKDPQLKHDRQGPQQASAASLQEHGEPANGERLPQPGQRADARRLRKNNPAARWLQAGP